MAQEKLRAVRCSPRRDPNSMWWILATDENSGSGVLVADCDGELVLPVFSGEAEAEMFVWLGVTFEDCCRVRKTPGGELVSVLHGPCSGVTSVALDPSPEMVEADAISLVSVSQERFVSCVVDSPCFFSRNRTHATTPGS